MNGATKFGLVAIGITLVHFPLTMVSFFAEMAAELGHIVWWAKPLPPLWHVLGFPAWLLVRLGLPDAVLLAAAVGNSVLWGATIAALWAWFRRRAGKRS